MDGANSETVEYQVYKRRFLIYALLALQIAIPIFGFSQFTAIANLVAKYYDVGFEEVNFTALICNICNLLLFYPVGRCVDKYGLRFSLILTATLNAFAAALKLIASQRSLLWLIYVAQCLHALPVLMSMAVIPLVSSNWFPPQEVAFVMGFSTVCTTMGTLVPFIFPSTVFKDAFTIAEIGNGLFYVNLTFAIVTFLAFLATVIIVKEKPPTPPSGASVFYDQMNTGTQSAWFIVTNRNVFLLLVYHALEFSLYQTIIITLNQSITTAFYEANNIVTIAGILINASGIPGSILVGSVIRKYPKYKLVLLLLNLLLSAALLLFMLSLHTLNLAALYIAMFLLSSANLGIQSFSMDFLLEVSYPNPAGILFAVVTAVGTLPSLLLAPLVTFIINKYSSFAASYVALFVSFFTIFSIILIQENLRRRDMDQETTQLLNGQTESQDTNIEKTKEVD